MKAWHVLAGMGVILLAGVLYYTLSPLFINIKVDEALPSPSENTGEQKKGQEEMPEKPAGEGPYIGKAGVVVGTTAHPAEGTAQLIAVNGKGYVRYENFKTINGPDLYVYLANDLEAKDYVSLGEIRATEGNINYEIPEGVDPSSYKYVLTWCQAFGVLFNYAEIN